ncbi:MAG: HAMP domain-containing protein, partial [Myxococcota bacterium]
MRFSFQRKILLTLLVALLVQMGVSIYLVWNLLDESLSMGLNPRIKSQLVNTIEVYKELFRTQKQLFGSVGAQLAADEAMTSAIKNGDMKAATSVGAAYARIHKEIARVSLVRGEASAVLYGSDRRDGGNRPYTSEYELRDSGGAILAVTFLAPEAQFLEMKSAQETIEVYGHIQHIKLRIARSLAIAYFIAFGAVMAVVVFLGFKSTRKFIKPLQELAAATDLVRRGDLSVNVKPASRDEIGDLTLSFNRMVRELRETRGRIIYLEKISSWQEIARRLAHEIKNPLTPIRLAMQQVHAKYKGEDPAFRRLLDQSNEIVEEEIASLGRLVDAFSSFAKLPAVQLVPLELNALIEDFLSAHNRFAEKADVTFIGGAGNAKSKLDKDMF